MTLFGEHPPRARFRFDITQPLTTYSYVTPVQRERLGFCSAPSTVVKEGALNVEGQTLDMGLKAKMAMTQQLKADHFIQLTEEGSLQFTIRESSTTAKRNDTINISGKAINNIGKANVQVVRGKVDIN